VDSAALQRLLDLNREFYREHGTDFSATRGRLQAGVLRVLGRLRGGESILDLGCGNGGLARTLSRRGHRGPYLGLDFSTPLLEEAGREALIFPVKFVQADLTSSGWADVIARSRWSSSHEVAYRDQATRQSAVHQELASLGLDMPSSDGYSTIARNDRFDIVFCFAVLHHIPSYELRLNIIRNVHELLAEGGRFIHSNWQFLNSERLKARIQTWDAIGLAAQDLDPGDYLLDWKRGGSGRRYVHYFNESELAELANAAGFEITETFYSDGENRRSGLYQVWRKT
jgi:tRNA (uracil-5-)-methyltransferase TRM9